MAQRRPLTPSQMQLMRKLARQIIDGAVGTETVSPAEAASHIVKLTLAASLIDALHEIERLSELRPAAEVPHGFLCGSCGAAPPLCCLDSCVRLKRALFYGGESNAQSRKAT